MKTNEEFIQGVYGKRDAIVKKRKKQMAFTATAVCAVLCVAAAITANMFGGSDIDKMSKTTEIEHGGYMNQNAHEAISGELKAETNEVPDNKLYHEASTEAFTFVVESYSAVIENAEGVPEIATEIALEVDSDDQFNADGAEGEMGVAENIEVITTPGNAVVAPAEPSSEAHKNGDVIEGETAIPKPTMPAPPKTPMYSTEEIVEAAYSVIPEEEREFIIKDSANATVTRYADGRQEYEVGFQTTQDKYIKVKLDSELNPVKIGS